MATPDVEMHGSDSDSALRESLGPDTLKARSIVPGAYRNAPRRGGNSHMGMGKW
jgi:hypothetical protein